MLKRRAVLLDFDHTLFDTDRFFWVDLRKAIACFGIEEKAWEEAYEAVWPGGYSLERHLAALMKIKAGRRPSKEAILSALRNAFSDLRGYLYPDVVPFLEEAKRRGFDLYLLSFGDPSWQVYKVKASGVAPYFQEVFYPKREQTKAEAVGGIVDRYETIHAIDNDPRELDLMKISYPQLLTHWISRVPSGAVMIDDPETRYRFREARRYVGFPSQHPHHHVTTLAEVAL
ncbi:MAG: HAD family hydrolase [Candidatus Methylomirabilales bacterium]